ncbi:bola-like protein, partial [Tothia fuscella]
EAPDFLDEKEKAIFDRLSDALEPTALEVQDISGGCGSMYAVSITTERFQGLPVIKQHRLVNEVLGEDIKSWHGIQLRTKA